MDIQEVKKWDILNLKYLCLKIRKKNYQTLNNIITKNINNEYIFSYIISAYSIFFSSSGRIFLPCSQNCLERQERQVETIR